MAELPFIRARAITQVKEPGGLTVPTELSQGDIGKPKRRSIFVSHLSAATTEAVKFKGILLSINDQQDVFLTSDWSSLSSGSLWLEGIFRALREMDQLVVLVTSKDALPNHWIHFEVGAAIGRGLKPKIFVFGGIDLSVHQVPPLSGIQMVLTGNTNRWIADLRDIGYEVDNDREAELAELFRQAAR